MRDEIFNEDFLDVAKRIPKGSIDCCITDSPYMCTSRDTSGNMGDFSAQTSQAV